MTIIRELWSNYRTEVFFFLGLSAFAFVSHWLSWFIPVDSFENFITPVQNAATITVCLVGAVMLFLHSDGLRTRKVWAWAMLIWGLADLFFLLQTYYLNIPVLLVGSDALTAYELLAGNFLGWLMLLYPTEALRPGWQNGKNAAIQLLPMMALVGLDYLLPVNLTPLIALYPVVLAGLLLSHIRAYRIWCEQNYSSMERIDVQWIVRYLAMLAVIGASFLYMCITVNPTRAFTQQWLLFFFFAYSTEQILFRTDPWSNVQTDNASGAKEEKEPREETDDTVQTDSVQILEEWIESEKPYLRTDFQLMDLRAVLPMNRTYLSHLINNTYGCSFFQYVNRYRIEEAKRLMEEHPNMKMTEIATRSGFSSPAIFSRVFSRETGLSPKEWSKKIHTV